MAPPPATPEQWLRVLEAVVRARDFAAALTMFAEDAVAFGTWARAVVGLDNIVRDARVRTSGDNAWIAAGWQTQATGPDSRPFSRPGRGTFILERRGGRWLAVHSHFSLLPSQSDAAHGRLPGDASLAHRDS